MTISSGRLAGRTRTLFALSPVSLLLVALSFMSLSLVRVTQAVAAPLAPSLGPEVVLAEPRDGFVGNLNVVPENGPAGTPLTVAAEKLPPHQEFQLVRRTVQGSWKVPDAQYHGREYQPVAYELAKSKSAQAGRLTPK